MSYAVVVSAPISVAVIDNTVDAVDLVVSRAYSGHHVVAAQLGGEWTVSCYLPLSAEGGSVVVLPEASDSDVVVEELSFFLSHCGGVVVEAGCVIGGGVVQAPTYRDVK